MNSLDFLEEEKHDIEASHASVVEAIARLNLGRDYDFIKALEKTKKQFESHLAHLESQIEKAKLSIDGLVVSNESDGYVISAKNLEGKDIFLRIRFFREDFLQTGDWNDSMFLDWTERFDASCFIQYEKFTVGNKTFDEDKFRQVYKHNKQKKGLEENVTPKSIKKRMTIKEDKSSYIFKDS